MTNASLFQENLKQNCKVINSKQRTCLLVVWSLAVGVLVWNTITAEY